jgi:hypothetical protein
MSNINLTMSSEQNGDMLLFNDRMRLVIRNDGTLVVSSKDGVQLTGDTLLKLIHSDIDVKEVQYLLGKGEVAR